MDDATDAFMFRGHSMTEGIIVSLSLLADNYMVHHKEMLIEVDATGIDSEL